MEPFEPATKDAILRNNPQATAADLDEYERLLAQRLAVDPDPARRPSRDARTRETAREARLAELHRILFPQAAQDSVAGARGARRGAEAAPAGLDFTVCSNVPF